MSTYSIGLFYVFFFLFLDNSGLNVTLWTKPSIKDITSFKFKIGTTNITYFAQDAFKNTAKCYFIVEIYGNIKIF